MKFFLLLLLFFSAQLHAQTDSSAMGLWKPTHPGECAQELHDGYFAVGPDNKRYPVWHPPVDPSGCFFGHEHGHNPALSPLDERGPLLFGYVNEQHALQDKTGHRHEDHVGHKVVVANDVQFGYRGNTDRITCDILTKLHQGTHSPDALTNNLHEQYDRMACSDGTYVNVQLLSAIGRAGWIEGAGSLDIYVGTPTPADSPIISNPFNPGKSMGDRDIAVAANLNVARPNLFEQWRAQSCINRVDNEGCAFRFANYWGVSNPSRHYDPSQPDSMGISLDVCWQKTLSGSYLVISGPCVKLRKDADNDPTQITKNSVDSIFKGDTRRLRPDSFTLRNDTDDDATINAAGNKVWWTSALGDKASTTPFPGSVMQEVSVGTHAPIPQYAYRGPAGGISGTATHPTVHAPN